MLHLFLGIAKDNTKDMYKKGRACIGEKNHLSKLNVKKILTIRLLYKSGWSQGEISRKFKVSQPTIFSIVNYKTWKHVKGKSA